MSLWEGLSPLAQHWMDSQIAGLPHQAHTQAPPVAFRGPCLSVQCQEVGLASQLLGNWGTGGCPLFINLFEIPAERAPTLGDTTIALRKWEESHLSA